MKHGKKHANNKGSNIIINASESESISTKKNKKIYTTLLEMVIIFIGVVSITLISINSYGIQVSYVFIIFSSLILTIILDLLIVKTIINRYLKILFFLLISLLIYLFNRNILNGFKSIANAITNAFSENSNINFLNIKYDNTYIQRDIDLFLLIALFILTMIISLAIRYKYNIILAAVIVVIKGVIIIYFGIFPSNFALVLLIGFIVSIIAIDIDYQEFKGKKLIVNYLEYSTKVKVGFLLIVLIMSIFSIIILVYPSKEYRRSETLEVVRNKFEDIYYNFSLEDIMSKMSTEANGGIDGGNLGTVDTLSYDNKVDLLVTLPESLLGQKGINTYLKGFVGGEYTGNSWVDVSEKDYRYYLDSDKNNIYQNNNYSTIDYMFNNYSKLDISNGNLIKSKIKINNIGANKKYIYAPYNVNYNNYNFCFNKDLFVSTDNVKKYEFDYFINDDSAFEENLASKFNKDSKEYKDYVYDVYTKLPLDSLEKIKKKYKDYYCKTSYDLDVCIEKVREDISSDTKYDLSPGKLPSGKDFVEYFLYENKKGYCSHYASTATVILRAMGIPARYVEGYLINSYEYTYYINPYKDNVEILDINNSNKEKSTIETLYSVVEVTDANAHAWVEVYDDKLGWVPVEVTPGIYYDQYSSLINDRIDSEEALINDKEKNKEFNLSHGVKRIFITFLIAIGVVSIIYLLFIRRIIKLRKRKYRNNKEEIISVYTYILEIFKFLGDNNEVYDSYIVYAKEIENKYGFVQKNEFINITYIIMRTKFYNEDVKDEEVIKVKKYANRLSNIIYVILPRLGKMKFKYIKNLI